MQRITFFFILFISALSTTKAQSLILDLPFHKGNTAYIMDWKGIRRDTLARCPLDPQTGKGQVSIPDKMPGIYTIYIHPDKNFDFVWSGKENMTITCSNEYIFADVVTFGHSPENDSLNAWFKRQYILQEKKGLNNAGINLYDSLSTQYRFFRQEMQRLQTQESTLNRQIARSTLYAAKYIEIRSFLERTAPALSGYSQNKIACEPFHNYYRDSLDMETLYTSGMWFNVINTSLELYRKKGEFQEEGVFKGQFANDITHILARIKSQEVYEALAHDALTMCEQFDWKQEATDITAFIIKENRIKDPQGIVKAAMGMLRLQPGQPAPEIRDEKGVSYKLTPTAVATPPTAVATVVIFYESGCGHCDQVMAELIRDYDKYKAKNIRIITISSDTDKQVFAYHSQYYPWPDKLCDFKGFQGENFKNYSVSGTPTIFVIDAKGIIKGKYANLIDAALL